MNITDIIDGYRQKIHDSPELTMTQASQYMVELSSYMTNINEEIRIADKAYNERLWAILAEPKMTVEKAKILSKTKDEYDRLQRAKNYLEGTLELIRSLKYMCKSLEHEYEGARNT